jgi:hypothetical protein
MGTWMTRIRRMNTDFFYENLKKSAKISSIRVIRVPITIS